MTFVYDWCGRPARSWPCSWSASAAR